MKPDELLRRLNNQDWECAYCGGPIAAGEELAVGYDNNAVVHLSCITTYFAPERPQ